jgi:hypothetical protein
VSAQLTAQRVTAAPAQPFKAVMSASASAILSGAEQAVTRLPGGPILAAALRSPATDVGASPAVASPSVASAGAGLSRSPEGGAGTAGASGGVGVGGTTDSSGGVEAALNQTANENLYFIELQERISAESRNYTAISNVLKARHDTVKNAIGNIR